MEKNSTKAIALIALLVAVAALAIGFATFTASLTISSNATIVPADTFSPYIKFKASSISCSVVNGSDANAQVTSAGSFDSDRVAWSGVSIKLIAPGDAAYCEATVENGSSFVAYLRSIVTTSGLQCTAGSTTGGISGATNYADVCEDLTLDIEVGTSAPKATAQVTNAVLLRVVQIMVKKLLNLHLHMMEMVMKLMV